MQILILTLGVGLHWELALAYGLDLGLSLGKRIGLMFNTREKTRLKDMLELYLIRFQVGKKKKNQPAQ